MELHPAKYASARGDPRLDLETWSRFLADSGARALLDVETGEDVDISLDGFRYVNSDGLACLLTLAQHLGVSRGHAVFLHVPSGGDIADQLVALGLAELEADGFQISGLSHGRARWKQTRPGLRASITQLTPTSIHTVQADIDRRFVSREFLTAIDLAPLSESRDFAVHLAEAVQEILRNVLQHSGVRRGFIAFQKVGNFQLQFIVADWGVGIHRSFATGTAGPEAHRIKEALLHRFRFPDRPGLFTVLRTVSRWGGLMTLRSGATLVRYRSEPAEVRDSVIATAVRDLPSFRVSQFPGVQCCVAFTIPKGR